MEYCPARERPRFERSVRSRGFRERVHACNERRDASGGDQRDRIFNVAPAGRTVSRDRAFLAERPRRDFEDTAPREVAHDHETSSGRERFDTRPERLLVSDKIERRIRTPSVGVTAHLLAPVRRDGRNDHGSTGRLDGVGMAHGTHGGDHAPAARACRLHRVDAHPAARAYDEHVFAGHDIRPA
jgi:hypothetical protein